MYSEIQKYLGQSWKQFQKMFADRLTSEISALNKINGYLGERAGKQLRPTLTLLTARALRGFCNENVVRCAAAVEMLHTATLLHDDVADDSPVRRGSPTIRSMYSPTTSVLIGDFWLSRAIETIVGYCDERVVRIFALSLQMLAEGEMIQLEKAESLDTTEEDYYRIIYRKTASLFETAIMSAAFSVKATQGEIEAFQQYACHLGLAFQIVDDILDYSPELNLGKPTGQDILEKKITLPLFGLIKNAPKPVVSELFQRMRQVGTDSKADALLAADAVSLVKQYGGLEYAAGYAEKETSLAIDSLSIIPDSQEKSYLIELAGHMAVRTR